MEDEFEDGVEEQGEDKRFVRGMSPESVAAGMLTSWQQMADHGGPSRTGDWDGPLYGFTQSQLEHRVFAQDMAVDLVDRWDEIPQGRKTEFLRKFFGRPANIQLVESFTAFVRAARAARKFLDDPPAGSLH